MHTAGRPRKPLSNGALRRLSRASRIAASVVGQLRYLGNDTLRELFLLPPDIGPLPVEINRLDNQALVRYYEAESRPWN